MSDLKERTIAFFENKGKMAKDVAELIGYGSGLDDEQFENWLEWYWHIDGDVLRVFEEKPGPDWFNDGEYYEYNISSFAAKGEKYFMGSKDGLTFVMGYNDEQRTSEANVHALDDSNKVTDD